MTDRKPKKIRPLSAESLQRVSSESLRRQRAAPAPKEHLRFWQSGAITSTTHGINGNHLVLLPHSSAVSFSHICMRDGSTIGAPTLSARIYSATPRGDARDFVLRAITPVANLREEDSGSFWLGSFGDLFSLALNQIYFLALESSATVNLHMTHASLSPLPGQGGVGAGLPDSFVFSQGRTNPAASRLPYLLLFDDGFFNYFNSFDSP